MAFKNAWRWSKAGGTAAQQNADEIDSDGVWVAEESDLRSDIPTLITFVKGSGADPVGASVAAGLKVNDTIATPEAIAGASLTLPSLATTQASLPVFIYPKGKVCLTVSGYVAPFKAGRIQ